MKKITVHSMYSVSEYILNLNNTITEKRYLSTNKERMYVHQKNDVSYDSIIRLFKSEKKYLK